MGKKKPKKSPDYGFTPYDVKVTAYRHLKATIRFSAKDPDDAAQGVEELLTEEDPEDIQWTDCGITDVEVEKVTEKT